jgi:hypothetical protein
MEQVNNALKNIEENIQFLSDVFQQDFLKKLLNDSIDKAYNTDKECSICSTQATLKKVDCCDNKLCIECTHKLNKCPFCRTVWNIENNRQEEENLMIEHHIISEEMNDNEDVLFDDSDDDEINEDDGASDEEEGDELYGSFNADEKSVIEDIIEEIESLYVHEFIKRNPKGEYPIFINPETNKEYRGSYTVFDKINRWISTIFRDEQISENNFKIIGNKKSKRFVFINPWPFTDVPNNAKMNFIKSKFYKYMYDDELQKITLDLFKASFE